GSFAAATSGGSAGGKDLSLEYHMCLFLDESLKGKGNEVVKGLVDDAAQNCGVHIKVFPFVVSGGYNGNDYKFINERQQKMCNLVESGIAKAASTSTCSHGQYADNLMCGDDQKDKNGNGIPGEIPADMDEGTRGCAQVAAARGVGAPNIPRDPES